EATVLECCELCHCPLTVFFHGHFFQFPCGLMCLLVLSLSSAHVAELIAVKIVMSATNATRLSQTSFVILNTFLD
ncbi:MAG: hypothetical protein ABFD63_01255, partial [Smithella sp.]